MFKTHITMLFQVVLEEEAEQIKFLLLEAQEMPVVILHLKEALVGQAEEAEFLVTVEVVAEQGQLETLQDLLTVEQDYNQILRDQRLIMLEVEQGVIVHKRQDRQAV